MPGYSRGLRSGVFDSPCGRRYRSIQYSGNPFAVTSGNSTTLRHPSQRQLHGKSILLPSAPFSGDNITSAVTTFSFTDGNQTLTNLNSSGFSFTISLDGSGALIGPWEIDIGDLQNGPGTFRHFLFPAANVATIPAVQAATRLRSSALRVSTMRVRGADPLPLWARRRRYRNPHHWRC